MRIMIEPEPAIVQVERLRELLDAVEDPLLLADVSGAVIIGNPAGAALLDTRPDMLAGRAIWEGGEDHPGLIDKAVIEKVRDSRLPAQMEIAKDGTVLEVRLYPILDPGGMVARIAVYVHDLVRRRWMEEALHQVEEMYRNIYENATEGIFQSSAEGRFLSGNPALARIHGYDSPEELMAQITDISRQLYVDPERRKELLSLLGRFGRAENFEARTKRKDGSIHWISINARLVRDKDGKPLYHEGTMRDISSRKENEEALRESEERYRTVVEHSNDGMAIITDNVHTYVNQRFVEMFEYGAPEEIVGTPTWVLVHPDDREMMESLREQRDRGEPVSPRYEFKGITKKGATIHLEASRTSMTYRGKSVSLVYLRDITERKKAEEALMESRNELERLNRAKGKAVNHISHELKTPLALSQGSLKMLRRMLTGTEPAGDPGKMLDILERNLDRLLDVSKETDQIIRASQDLEASALRNDMDRLEQRMEGLSEVPEDMLAHTRAIRLWIDRHTPTGRGRFKVIELLPFVDDTIEKVRYFARNRQVRVVREGGDSRLHITMNQEILREILEALLKNAVKNTPDGGQVTVRIEKRGGMAWIDVIDTGVGISEENQPYVFDGLFHTTETDLYSSRGPYDFGAGGKGLDLLKLKVYAKRFGFELAMRSTRCPHIPTDRDICPGKISECLFVKSPQECALSGGSTFSIAFRASGASTRKKRRSA